MLNHVKEIYILVLTFVQFWSLIIENSFLFPFIGHFLQWIGITLRMALFPMASR